MTDTTTSQKLTSPPPAQIGVRHITSVSPITVVIPPPAEHPAPLTVTLPADLAADLHRHFAALDADHAARGFRRCSFETWLADILRDHIYGRGNTRPGAW